MRIKAGVVPIVLLTIAGCASSSIDGGNAYTVYGVTIVGGQASSYTEGQKEKMRKFVANLFFYEAALKRGVHIGMDEKDVVLHFGEGFKTYKSEGRDYPPREPWSDLHKFGGQIIKELHYVFPHQGEEYFWVVEIDGAWKVVDSLSNPLGYKFE